MFCGTPDSMGGSLFIYKSLWKNRNPQLLLVSKQFV